MDRIYRTHEGVDEELEKLEDADFTNRELVILSKFLNYLRAEDLSDHRILRYCSSLKTLSHAMDFEIHDPSREELVKLVGDINNSAINQRTYSPWTKAEFKKLLKKFYEWLPDFDYQENLDFMTTYVKESDRKYVDPWSLPQPKDVIDLRKHACNRRDELFWLFLWETGGRIGEVLSVKWRHVKDRGDYSMVHFPESKTRPRTVPIKDSRSDLRAWKKRHPDSSPENHVFSRLSDPGQITYSAMNGMAQRVSSHAEPSCDTNFHAFRKSRATFLATRGLNAYQIMHWFGWSDPDTAITYIRLANSDLEKAFREVHPDLDVDDSEKVKELTELLSESSQGRLVA